MKPRKIHKRKYFKYSVKYDLIAYSYRMSAVVRDLHDYLGIPLPSIKQIKSKLASNQSLLF